MDVYPGAITAHRSPIDHPRRQQTLGVCIHNTYGSHDGDLATLTSGNVDCAFYVDKRGRVYQLTDPDVATWTAYSTANHNSVHIEHEGMREVPWTTAQLEASAKLVAWLCRRYGIPVRHVDPPREWRGLFDHRDLQGIDGNDHGDGVPTATGWPVFLDRVQHHKDGTEPLPYGNTLRLVVEDRRWAGWEQTAGALRWIAANGLKRGTRASLSWRGSVWRGPKDVTNVARNLVRNYLGA